MCTILFKIHVYAGFRCPPEKLGNLRSATMVPIGDLCDHRCFIGDEIMTVDRVLTGVRCDYSDAVTWWRNPNWTIPTNNNNNNNNSWLRWVHSNEPFRMRCDNRENCISAVPILYYYYGCFSMEINTWNLARMPKPNAISRRRWRHSE